MRINNLPAPSGISPKDAGELLKEIDILTRRMTKGRITKITKMTDGTYCIRIEKYNNAEKLSIDKNGKVLFTVGSQKYVGSLKSTASFPEELIAVICGVKQGV